MFSSRLAFAIVCLAVYAVDTFTKQCKALKETIAGLLPEGFVNGSVAIFTANPNYTGSKTVWEARQVTIIGGSNHEMAQAIRDRNTLDKKVLGPYGFIADALKDARITSAYESVRLSGQTATIEMPKALTANGEAVKAVASLVSLMADQGAEYAKSPYATALPTTTYTVELKDLRSDSFVKDFQAKHGGAPLANQGWQQPGSQAQQPRA